MAGKAVEDASVTCDVMVRAGVVKVTQGFEAPSVRLFEVR
mgnify:CR=1 FL=1